MKKLIEKYKDFLIGKEITFGMGERFTIKDITLIDEENMEIKLHQNDGLLLHIDEFDAFMDGEFVEVDATGGFCLLT